MRHDPSIFLPVIKRGGLIGLSQKPRTLADYLGLLRTHAATCDAAGRLTNDCLGRPGMEQITREHVRALHLKLKDKPRTANYMLAFIGVLFSEACGEGGCLPESYPNPARRIKKFPERQRERFPTAEELHRLGAALAAAEESEEPSALAAVRLLIFTGARLSEILTLRWTEVELAQAALQLQDNKAATTTTSSSIKIKTIHLSEPALEVIAKLPRVHGNPFVIAGKKERQHWVNLRKVWVRLCQAAAIETGDASQWKTRTYAPARLTALLCFGCGGEWRLTADYRQTAWAHQSADHEPLRSSGR